MIDPQPASFSPEQQVRIDLRTADQDRTLLAMHAVEGALAAAAPRKQGTWGRDVLAALAALDDATRDEQDNADRADSLLSDIKRTQPLLASRVRGVRAQYHQLRDGVSSLRRELEQEGEGRDLDPADIRQRLAWVLTAIRHQRARESDLIYEAYYEAFQAELGP